MDVVIPKPGRYVIAVSGGVDSMALLHMLHAAPGLELVVAHIDHGMRADSSDDRRLVESMAKSYKLPFIYKTVNLGHGASEATARRARYEFLDNVVKEHEAQAIITAHHQDDVLETAIINLRRGTGRKGLTSLGNRLGLLRPLIQVSKAEILEYAKDNKLQWHEDSTNSDDNYLRNYIRHNVVSKLDEQARAKLVKLLADQKELNQELDNLLANSSEGDILDRRYFNLLPHSVAKEVMAAWLRRHGVRDFSSATLERLVTSGKVARADSNLQVIKNYKIEVSKDNLALVGPER